MNQLPRSKPRGIRPLAIALQLIGAFPSVALSAVSFLPYQDKKDAAFIANAASNLHLSEIVK